MSTIDLEVIKKELKPVERPSLVRSEVANLDAEYFRPSAKQRKLKEAFRTVCKSLPTDRREITLEFVRGFIESKDIERWWCLPGFISWFRRDEAVGDRLQYLYQLRLDAIEAVLEDDSGAITPREKLAAGAELDKVAKTLTEASSQVEKKDTRDLASRIKDEMERSKIAAGRTPQEIAAEIVAKKLESPVVLPDIRMRESE
jgi:hypothetical protein